MPGAGGHSEIPTLQMQILGQICVSAFPAGSTDGLDGAVKPLNVSSTGFISMHL